MTVISEVEADTATLANLEAVMGKGGQAMGEQVWIEGTPHFVADIKTVRCIAVEGSLPHIIGANAPRFSVDLRTKKGSAVTFQVDRDEQSLWRGAYYRLDDLEPAGLRRFEHWPAPDFEVAG